MRSKKSPAAGHAPIADAASSMLAAGGSQSLAGQTGDASALRNLPAGGTQSLMVGHVPDADQSYGRVSSISDPIIAEIRSWHRQRCFAMEQRKRADLALLAFLRTQLGWSLALPNDECKAIATQAMKMLALGEKVFKGKATGIDDAAFGQWSGVIIAAISARKVWDDIEGTATKEMSRLALTLPAWATFGEGVRGFGSVSLAVIVGESGDLALYSNPGKLWKRMGLAVFGGVRQGGLPKSASADEWVAHGYNRQRRSRMFVIGDCLIKSNRGAYRRIYDERKAYEVARDPDMKPIKAHRRAQRYMEKRLLKDLWQAWRRATGHMPAATSSPQGERAANGAVASVDRLSRAKKKRANPAMLSSVEPPASG